MQNNPEEEAKEMRARSLLSKFDNLKTSDSETQEVCKCIECATAVPRVSLQRTHLCSNTSPSPNHDPRTSCSPQPNTRHDVSTDSSVWMKNKSSSLAAFFTAPSATAICPESSKLLMRFSLVAHWALRLSRPIPFWWRLDLITTAHPTLCRWFTVALTKLFPMGMRLPPKSCLRSCLIFSISS